MERVILAAPSSGSGKTTITCGLLAALKNRGIAVGAVKCGPDYIDPMFHRRMLEVPSGNLDSYFTTEEMTRALLAEKCQKNELTILEGVMGYYDGLGGQTDIASTYEMARITNTPVVLVVNGKGASVSLAAVIKGIMDFREDSNIQGVILNQVSEGYYERIKNVIEENCKIKVLGYLPVQANLQVPSRHLGLVSPDEIEHFQQWRETMIREVEKRIDMDGLLQIAKSAPSIEIKNEINVLCNSIAQNQIDNNEKFLCDVLHEESNDFAKRIQDCKNPVIAIARDEAFSFYYQENIELLEKLGAKIIYFSPMWDKEIPAEASGVIFWGGYPERFAKVLSENLAMRENVRKNLDAGMPCIAECGGFLYLQNSLEDEEGTVYPMVGYLKGDGTNAKKLCRFGYLTAVAKKAGMIGSAGMKLRGHEFHHWDCTQNGQDFLAEKYGGASYDCIWHSNHLFAGFPHFYYYSCPEMVLSFVDTCISYRAKQNAKKHWDAIAKPIDSLGKLEDMVCKLSYIAQNETPYDLSKKALVVLCADHGVVAEGVTQTDSSVTKVVSENFALGKSTVNILSGQSGTDVFAIDIGMDTDVYETKELITGKVIDRKIRRGTENLRYHAAMTEKECQQAIEVGIQIVKELKDRGYRVIANGEMGIGNTTPTAVMAALLTGLNPEAVTGKGAGLSDEGLSIKQRVVADAVCRIENAYKESKEKNNYGFFVLQQGGGLELAGMVGLYLGGLKYKVPIIIDGAISAVAALCASRIDARCVNYMLASHMPVEQGGAVAMRTLGLEPIIHGNLCLGEGSGAVMLMPFLEMAVKVYENMGSFEDYKLVAYERF